MSGFDPFQPNGRQFVGLPRMPPANMVLVPVGEAPSDPEVPQSATQGDVLMEYPGMPAPVVGFHGPELGQPTFLGYLQNATVGDAMNGFGGPPAPSYGPYGYVPYGGGGGGGFQAPHPAAYGYIGVPQEQFPNGNGGQALGHVGWQPIAVAQAPAIVQELALDAGQLPLEARLPIGVPPAPAPGRHVIPTPGRCPHCRGRFITWKILVEHGMGCSKNPWVIKRPSPPSGGSGGHSDGQSDGQSGGQSGVLG